MRFSRERGRCHLPQSTANLCLHAAHKVSSETCFSYIMESERLRDYRPYGQRFNGKWDSCAGKRFPGFARTTTPERWAVVANWRAETSVI